MGAELWISLAVTTALATSVPGPSTLLAFAHGAQHGVASAKDTVAGITAASLLQSAAAGSGIAVLLIGSPGFLPLLKVLGALFLIFIGIGLWRREALRPDKALAVTAGATRGRFFSEGFVVALGNPKAIFFFLALFPQFLAEGSAASLQLVMMILLVCAVIYLVTFLYAAAGMRLADRWRSPHGGKWLGRGVAVFLVLSGFLLLFQVQA